jgi:hypothetical protein
MYPFFVRFISSYFGLVSFWIARDLNNKKYIAKKWIARGAESKVAIEKLAVLASIWNFQNSECRFVHDREKGVSLISHILFISLILQSIFIRFVQKHTFSKLRNNSVHETLRLQKNFMTMPY